MDDPFVQRQFSITDPAIRMASHPRCCWALSSSYDPSESGGGNNSKNHITATAVAIRLPSQPHRQEIKKQKQLRFAPMRLALPY
jgi:hypothetical protein